MINKLILQKAAKIKLLILDVDGVLTTGKLFFTARGEEIKVFHVRDGYGMKALLGSGIEIAVITGRRSEALMYRMQELGVKYVYQGQENKNKAFLELKEKLCLNDDQIAYVGDDLPDLELIKLVGLGVAVVDAVEEVRSQAALVTKAKGGKGAVREVCDLILHAHQELNL